MKNGWSKENLLNTSKILCISMSLHDIPIYCRGHVMPYFITSSTVTCHSFGYNLAAKMSAREPKQSKVKIMA